MEPSTEMLLRSAAAMAVAFAGAGIAVFARRIGHYQLCAMISIAAGALLGVTTLHLLPEALGELPLLEFGLAIISGYMLFLLVSRYIAHICPACAASHIEERMAGISILMVVAISLHSTMDGIAVAAGHAHGEGGHSIALFLAVSIHKLPEGLALASVGRAAGYSRAKALGVACAVESTTLLGALIAVFGMGTLSPFWLAILMAHIGGGFFYLTIHAMLGEMLKHEKRNILIYAATGYAVILFSSLALIAMET